MCLDLPEVFLSIEPLVPHFKLTISRTVGLGTKMVQMRPVVLNAYKTCHLYDVTCSGNKLLGRCFSF